MFTTIAISNGSKMKQAYKTILIIIIFLISSSCSFISTIKSNVNEIENETGQSSDRIPVTSTSIDVSGGQQVDSISILDDLKEKLYISSEKIINEKGFVLGLDINPNGEYFAIYSTSGIWIYSMDDQSLLAKTDKFWSSLHWSATGEYFAQISSSYIDIYRFKNKQLDFYTNLEIEGDIYGFAWSPLDDQIAISTKEKLFVWDFHLDKWVYQKEADISPITIMKWSPDGKNIGVGVKGNVIAAKTNDTFRVIQINGDSSSWGSMSDEITNIGWLEDSSLLYTQTRDGVQIWNAVNGEMDREVKMLGDTSEWNPNFFFHFRKIILLYYLVILTRYS